MERTSGSSAKSKRKRYISPEQLSNALFVISQIALKLKYDIVMGYHNINNGNLDESALNREQQMISKKHKQYNNLQRERTLILRHLILTGKAKLENYVFTKNTAYGHLTFNKHKFYVIINKRIIEYYKLEQVGDSMPDLPFVEEQELERLYMPIDEAKMVFKRYAVVIKTMNEKRKGTEHTKKVKSGSKSSKSVQGAKNID